MRCVAFYSLALATVLTACSSSTVAKHVSAAKFERSFNRSQTIAMQHFFYSGETNGCVYISRITWANWSAYSKPHWQTFFTETNWLPPGFLDEVRRTIPPRGGPATNWSGKPKAERNASGDAGFSLSLFFLGQRPGAPELSVGHQTAL